MGMPQYQDAQESLPPEAAYGRRARRPGVVAAFPVEPLAPRAITSQRRAAVFESPHVLLFLGNELRKLVRSLGVVTAAVALHSRRAGAHHERNDMARSLFSSTVALPEVPCHGRCEPR